MLQELIRSLAETPHPIIPDKLPPPQIYILHDALTWIERYWRMAEEIPYPPQEPQPYEIPQDIAKSIERSIRALPLNIFQLCVKAFLQNLRVYAPVRETLLQGLATALLPPKYLHLFPDQTHSDPTRRTRQKTNLQDAPRREISPRPIQDHPPVNGQGKQKTKVIPIKKPSQPLSAPTKLADQWKLDGRWSKLFPVSISCLYAVLRRTCNEDTFKKRKQAFSKGQNFFPWCLKGIESLSKKIFYTTRSNPIPRNYSTRQIERGMKQLEDLGFISTFYRGYEGQGAGKCFVFLNPKMSAAFHRESWRHKKGSAR